jgi:hypothetical protein
MVNNNDQQQATTEWEPERAATGQSYPAGTSPILLEKWEVREQPFVSRLPVIGRLIALFRESWNRVSTKWYVRPLLQQQNEFNYLASQQIHTQEAWLSEQDQQQSHLTRDLAEATAQLIQMNQLLHSIEARLARLEKEQNSIE